MARRLVATLCLPDALCRAIFCCMVFPKFEGHEFTASFEEHDALKKPGAERVAGVVAMTAGNNAQRPAYLPMQPEHRPLIFMPMEAPLTDPHGRAIDARTYAIILGLLPIVGKSEQTRNSYIERCPFISNPL